MPQSTVPAVIVTALVSVILAFVLIKFLDRLRRKDAETDAVEILERAKRDAENLRKESQLEMKEQTLQHKSNMERELSKVRDQLRDR